MEIRRESLSLLKLCRFCLSQDDTLTTLYGKKRAPKNVVSLPLKILSCMSIEVFPSDKMPTYICQRCKFFMDVTYEYKQICRQADENILQFVQNGKPLDSVQWPKILTELPPLKKVRSPEFSVETEEGATTVQVTTRDGTDSEEEEVIDIKIADGSDENSKGTSIKLVAPTDEDNKNKRTTNTKVSSGADSDEIEIMYERNNRVNVVTSGCWPCDECDCTYPLQQLLELHKMQKHRERPENCEQCDAKFFTKADLTVHQLQHSDTMLFQCVACDKQFKRHILLKRHEKLTHSDLPQHYCPRCPATFLSLETLEAHQQRHSRPSNKRFKCVICKETFQQKTVLLRHKLMVHNKTALLSCEYCPERFRTVSKLVRHVRSHAGERSYPCKYCEKSFLKSHHYTRHLRVKHREVSRMPKERMEEPPEQYRCEQCEDCFNTQDDLIYHSAIHATQNLICPLCQEKFDDVEAVTAHIRSHVDGTEFMCDFCELVFTTQEKLENHMINSHDDEMRNIEQDMDQDESSMEMEAEDDDDDNAINVTEENGHMVVEIKKAHEFMLRNESEDKHDNTNSEESESETTYTELATVDTLALSKGTTPATVKPSAGSKTVVTKLPGVAGKQTEKTDAQTASILRRAEDIKRKATQQAPGSAQNQAKKINAKSEASSPVGANDKSLRLLEKELQELKRTNTRASDTLKTVKNAEILKSKRPQIHTSTPKQVRATEEKKSQVLARAAATEKKQPDRRVVTKENKEPKEQKSTTTSAKEDKEKEKETPKNSAQKNGAEDTNIRRSTRPSKIKDYAKMINDRSQDSDDNNDSDYNEDSEEDDAEQSIETRPKPRRVSIKQAPAKATPPPVTEEATPAPRKRGRPRKDKGLLPTKIKKEDTENSEVEHIKVEKEKINTTVENKDTACNKETAEDATNTKQKNPELNTTAETGESAPGQKLTGDVLVSPLGQTLKKIPVKALPPGIKALPLPANTRPVSSGEVCEMLIGSKMVKVQKIVMTKAEVEAMTKKGLVEVKNGTMVLKKTIKMPTIDAAGGITSPVTDKNDADKETPNNKDSPKKGAPTRCDLEEA